jgi:hypothetical protein
LTEEQAANAYEEVTDGCRRLVRVTSDKAPNGSGLSRTQRPTSRLSTTCAALEVVPASRSFRAGSESSAPVDGSGATLCFGSSSFSALLVLPSRLALVADLAELGRIEALQINAGRKPLFRVVAQPSLVRHVQ